MKPSLITPFLITLSLASVVLRAVPEPDDFIQPPSLELERRVEPWCPDTCAVAVSFVASYRKGQNRLVFVATRHAFDPNDPTMRAVKAGFAAVRPHIVILEGFPTAMGENPPPLVDEARRYGAPDAPNFDRGEAMYAASLALARNIPFIGGEPTEEEQIQALKAHGFTDNDIAFNALLGWYSQALRAGDLPSTSLENLAKVYPQLAQNVRDQTHLDPPTLDALRQRYRTLYGTDLVGDRDLLKRIDVGDTTEHGQQATVAMMIRDRHLLRLIEQQWSNRRTVLVVYGASHWATLSTALEHQLGKPTVLPFLP